MVPLRIGTRGSPLALAQANEVGRLLVEAGIAAEEGIEITVIHTRGDQTADWRALDAGGKGLFTKEIDVALLSGRIEMAVHSMKDLPTEIPAGIVVDCLLPREDPRDVLLGVPSIAALKKGAVLGTSSVRRGAQVRHLRPDISLVAFQGNVQTRIRKLAEGAADATMLAFAGLRRLGMDTAGGVVLEPDEILPAAAQGAVGIAVPAAAEVLRERLVEIHDSATGDAVACERALLASLDGSCRTPIAALAILGSDGELSLRAALLTADGSERFDATRSGSASDAQRMGREAGAELRAAARAAV